MSMNGVTGYNSYAYSNPYAYSNNGTSFQGYTQGAAYSTATTEEKDKGVNPLLVVGGVLAAAGGIAYAIKRGKTINSLGDDAAKGLKGVWNNLTTGVKSLFTKTGRREYKFSKEVTSAKDIMETATKGKLTQEAKEALTQDAAKKKVTEQIKNGEIKLTSITDEAENKLTGEALEKAKKARKEEFSKAMEEAKKTVTGDDIINQSKLNYNSANTKLNKNKDLKSMVNDINDGKEISLDQVNKIYTDGDSKTYKKIVKDGKVDTEALKKVLEKTA